MFKIIYGFERIKDNFFNLEYAVIDPKTNNVCLKDKRIVKIREGLENLNKIRWKMHNNVRQYLIKNSGLEIHGSFYVCLNALEDVNTRLLAKSVEMSPLVKRFFEKPKETLYKVIKVDDGWFIKRA